MLIKVLFIFFLITKQVFSSVNLALKKPVYLTNNPTLGEFINDGVVNSKRTNFNVNRKIIIDLIYWTQVSNITIYKPEDCCDESLRTIQVFITDNFLKKDNLKICNVQISSLTTNKYFVDCEESVDFAIRFVILTVSPTNEDVSVSEVEVYGTTVDLFIGCFNYSFINVKVSEKKSLDDCFGILPDDNTKFIGIRNITWCLITNIRGRLIPLKFCEEFCFSDTEHCTSVEFFKLYRSKPCKNKDTSTVQPCVFYCLHSNYLSHGKCSPPGCKPGFKGEACNIRDCNSDLNSCNNGICQVNQGSDDCECYQGYSQYHRLTPCIDINECEESKNVCNISNTQCYNTHGSFYCKCINSNIYLSPGQSVDHCFFDVNIETYLTIAIGVACIIYIIIAYLYLKLETKEKEIKKQVVTVKKMSIKDSQNVELKKTGNLFDLFYSNSSVR